MGLSAAWGGLSSRDPSWGKALWGIKGLYLLPDGLPVAHLNKNETDYTYNEIFILQAYLCHGITIHDGDCIVDAGVNIGLFTVFASRLARDLRVFSFEPNPSVFECLKANAEARGTARRSEVCARRSLRLPISRMRHENFAIPRKSRRDVRVVPQVLRKEDKPALIFTS